MKSLTIALMSFVALVSAVGFLGCGAVSHTENCSILAALKVSPQQGTADHTAIPPGNQVSFAAVPVAQPGCALPEIVPYPATWSTSDPVNTSIGATTGLATCINATSTPATITATAGGTSGTATLSCT